MSSNPTVNPLKVRRATSLDRQALQTWLCAFAFLTELEGSTSLASTENTHAHDERVTHFVVLCDAIRIAFAELATNASGSSEIRLFIKPAAWAKVPRHEIARAIQAHAEISA